VNEGSHQNLKILIFSDMNCLLNIANIPEKRHFVMMGAKCPHTPNAICAAAPEGAPRRLQ
jgi:hypothetical protein